MQKTMCRYLFDLDRWAALPVISPMRCVCVRARVCVSATNRCIVELPGLQHTCNMHRTCNHAQAFPVCHKHATCMSYAVGQTCNVRHTRKTQATCMQHTCLYHTFTTHVTCANMHATYVPSLVGGGATGFAARQQAASPAARADCCALGIAMLECPQELVALGRVRVDLAVRRDGKQAMFAADPVALVLLLPCAGENVARLRVEVSRIEPARCWHQHHRPMDLHACVRTCSEAHWPFLHRSTHTCLSTRPYTSQTRGLYGALTMYTCLFTC